MATEREAEEGLRRSHETFRLLVEGSPFGVYVVDGDFRLALVSRGAQKVFSGVRPLLGRDFAEVLRTVWPEPFASEAIGHFRHTLDTGEPYHAPRTVERRGDTEDIEAYDWKLERVALPDGRVGVVCHFYDLTERLQAEAALRESEGRFRLMADTVPMMTWITDAQGNVELLSRQWLEYSGAPPGKTAAEVAAESLHPEDGPRLMAAFAEAMQTGKGFALEQRNRSATGEYRWFLNRAEPYRDPSTGEIVKWFGVGVDIHDRRRAEASAALLAGLAADFAGLSAEGEIIEAVGVRLSRHLGLSLVQFGWVDEARDEARFTHRWYREGAPVMPEVVPISRFVNEAYRREARAGGTIVCRDTQADPRTEAAATAALDIYSYVGVPYLNAGRWASVLTVADSKARDWAEDEVALVREVSDRLVPRLERARAERDLKESEERYRTLFESMDQGYCVIEMLYGEDGDGMPDDWRFMQANPAFERHNGLSGATGKTIKELTPDIEPVWFERYGGVDRTGQPVRFQEHSPALGRWFDVYAFRVGEPQEHRVAVLFSDITERRQDQATLAASEARYRALAQATSQFVWRRGVEREDPQTQAWWAELTGQTLEETAGWGWLLALHPEDRERARRAWSAAFEHNTLFDTEYRVRTKEDQYVYLEVRGVPVLDENGTVKEWIGSFTDVTEQLLAEAALKESEARFRWLAEATPQMVWVFDAQSRLTYVNSRFSEYTGLSLEQAASGEPDVIHPDDLAAFVAAGEKASAEQGLFQVEVRIRRAADGAYRWFLHTAIPIREGGALVGWYGTSLDVHDRKLAAEALAESEAKYRKLAESQKRFVNDASHELRAPLTAIQGNLELLTRFKNMRRADREAALEEVGKEAQRLSRLVNDMLALARGETGSGLRKERLDLAALLREACSDVRSLAKRHSLEADLSGPLEVSADRDRIKQVAMQLLENALKYTPAGGRITLELIHTGEWAEFRVADSGIGIAPEELTKVFERFYRSDKARLRREDPGGTGLGLAIAKQIAEGHGGEIWLESELGKGTTAVVRLPLAEG